MSRSHHPVARTCPRQQVKRLRRLPFEAQRAADVQVKAQEKKEEEATKATAAVLWKFAIAIVISGQYVAFVCSFC